VDAADLVDAVRRLTPPQHMAAMDAVAQARQTGDLGALLQTLTALAQEVRAAEG
jgi:hypothetical protein